MQSAEVSEADRQAFQRWLNEDPAHRAAYAEAEALWQELGQLADPRRPAASGGPEPARATAGTGRPRTARSRWRTIAVAASLLLALLIGLGPLAGFDNLRADHVTAVGEIRAITLEDGSRVHLNTDTALSVHFSGDRRGIELHRGEAFFTVAADSTRPFEVRAGGLMTRAVGTAFNVHMHQQAVDVAVTEGSVRVIGAEASESGGVLVKSGEAARYTPDGDLSSSQLAAATHPAAWRQGRLVFADQPLQRVIAELDRYRVGRILLLDASLANARFSGTLRLHHTESALTAIQNTLPVDIIRLTPYLTLLQSRQ